MSMSANPSDAQRRAAVHQAWEAIERQWSIVMEDCKAFLSTPPPTELERRLLLRRIDQLTNVYDEVLKMVVAVGGADEADLRAVGVVHQKVIVAMRKILKSDGETTEG